MAEEKVSIIYTVVDNASKAAAGIGKGFSELKKNALAVGAGIVALIASFDSFLKATEGQEKATAKLNQALKNQGLFTAKTSKDIEDYSSALQKMTVYGDEAITEVQAMLVAQGLHGETLKKATKATLDFAAANGMDLQSAGALMAKAAGGMTSALSRYGIQTTDANGKTITFSGAIDQINGKWGGFAQQIANTPTGKIDQLKNAFGDIQELLGSVISTGFVPIANLLLGLKDRFDSLNPNVQRFIGVAVVLGITMLGLLPVAVSLAATFAAISWPVYAVIGAVALLTAGFFAFKDQIGATINFLKNTFISFIQLYLNYAKLLLNGLDSIIEKFNAIAKKIPGIPVIDLGTDKAIEKLDSLNQRLETAKTNNPNNPENPENDPTQLTELEQADIDKTQMIADTKHNIEVDTVKKTNADIEKEQKEANNKRIAMGNQYVDAVSAAAQNEGDIVKATAQGSLDFVKQQLLAEVKARAARLFAEGAAELPLLLTGNPSGPLKIAAAGAMTAAGTSAINAIKLAQGGQFDVDSPTMVGPGIIAGEAGPERVRVEPLEKQGGDAREVIILTDDGTQLAKGIWKKQQAMRQTGEISS